MGSLCSKPSTHEGGHTVLGSSANNTLGGSNAGRPAPPDRRLAAAEAAERRKQAVTQSSQKALNIFSFFFFNPRLRRGERTMQIRIKESWQGSWRSKAVQSRCLPDRKRRGWWWVAPTCNFLSRCEWTLTPIFTSPSVGLTPVWNTSYLFVSLDTSTLCQGSLGLLYVLKAIKRAHLTFLQKPHSDHVW